MKEEFGQEQVKKVSEGKKAENGIGSERMRDKELKKEEERIKELQERAKKMEKVEIIKWPKEINFMTGCVFCEKLFEKGENVLKLHREATKEKLGEINYVHPDCWEQEQ